MFHNPGHVPIDYTVRVFETEPRYELGTSTLSFEPNRGQADTAASFIANGRGFSIGLTGGQATLVLAGARGTAGATAAMVLVDADPLARGEALEAQAGVSNYLSSGQSLTGVPHFGRVRYTSVYAGIDLEYYGRAGLLEYDWVVQPGADVGAIGVRFSGIDRYRLDSAGNLLIDVPNGQLVQRAPVASQIVEGVRQEVQASFDLRAGSVVGLKVGDHDPSLPLTIDPVLVYASYLGGSGFDAANAVAVDAQGKSYVVGSTGSTDFYTVDAIDPELNQPDTPYYAYSLDAFVTKFDPSGTLLYSTYLGGGSLGGSMPTLGWAVDVDDAGRVGSRRHGVAVLPGHEP